MRQGALEVLEDWGADLAIVGLVKKSGESLSLWFVPRSGDGTLDRPEPTFRLEDVTLGRDFHDDLRVQISAIALAAVAPLADTEVRGQNLEQGLKDATEKLSGLLEGPTIGSSLAAVAPLADTEVRGQNLEQGLKDATEKLSGLLEGPTIGSSKRRAVLYVALGTALQSLGERESGTARLEQAVEAHRSALEVLLREHVPLDWAATQISLGNALATIGKRESGTARLGTRPWRPTELPLRFAPRVRVPHSTGP